MRKLWLLLIIMGIPLFAAFVRTMTELKVNGRLYYRHDIIPPDYIHIPTPTVIVLIVAVAFVLASVGFILKCRKRFF